MRILQVVHGFPPKRRAGTELYTYYLSKELVKKHEIHIFYPTFDKTVQSIRLNSFERENMHLHELRMPSTRWLWHRIFLQNTYLDKKVEQNFMELLNRIQPDIIHFQHLIDLSTSLIKIASEKNIPTVLTLHDYWFMCPNIHLIKYDYTICEGPSSNRCYGCWTNAQSKLLSEIFGRYYIPEYLTKMPLKFTLETLNSPEKFEKRNEYLKSLLLNVDKIIAPSRFLREMFVKYGIPKDKIIYSRNGYKLEPFKGFTKKRKDIDMVIFGFAGNVAPIKGVHILIDAFLQVPEDKAELRIYGSYDLKSKYFKELLLKTGKKDNIKFLGRYEDVKQPYSEIDVLIFPSIVYENCPLVLQEAKITKTPVIASNLGAIPEFVKDGKTGLLFEPNNPEDLFGKIMRIVEHPELIEKFKANITPPRSIEEQAKEIEEIYISIIGGR